MDEGKSLVTVIDVGLGNVRSVVNMFRRLGFPVRTADVPPPQHGDAEALVLPGVGAFDEGVRRLIQTGWYEFLQQAPAATDILGICLGMQLLGTGSEEGRLPGIGRLDVEFRRFRRDVRLPHMGWNRLFDPRDDIFPPDSELRFYFAHSYYAVCADPNVITARADYGGPFVAAVRDHRTVGVQFHPEKSHRYGLDLLSRWARSCS